MTARFIVVDGIDGSGKSTIANWIAERYRDEGCEVEVMHHPSERTVGRMSRSALQSRGKVMHTVAAVFYIIDVLCSVKRVRGAKGTEENIIFVRYLMGTAYLPGSLMQFGYDFFCKILPVPKEMLLVDIDPSLAKARLESRPDEKEMFEDLESLTKYRRKCLVLAKKGWVVLDNSGPIQETRSKLEGILSRWERDGLTDL